MSGDFVSRSQCLFPPRPKLGKRHWERSWWLPVTVLKYEPRGRTNKVGCFRMAKRTIGREQSNRLRGKNETVKLQQWLIDANSNIWVATPSFNRGTHKDKRTFDSSFGLSQQYKRKCKNHIKLRSFLEFLNQNTIVALEKGFITKFSFHYGPGRVIKRFSSKTGKDTRVKTLMPRIYE